MNLNDLFAIYLKTLDDNDHEEYYMTAHGFARWQIIKFVQWLYINYPDLISKELTNASEKHTRLY